jgi:predicted lysophospholipase L1 biosynthesis ABC-type transport system permease subunit
MFTDADRRGAARVVLASEAAVRRFWPHGDAIGHHVRLDARSGPDRVEGEIVGIVGDVHDQSLAEEPDPTFYGPFDQVGADVVTIVARASGTPASLAAAASDEIRRLDGSLPIVHVTTMESVVAESLGGPRFYALMLGVFAAVAMVLAAVGVSGIVAYSVSQRRREIGIRRALGAEERQIVWMILARSGALTLAGLALGLAGSIGVTRVLARLLVGVSPTDPTVLIGVALILAAVAFLASYLPARGAGKVDPIVVLRSE